MPTRSSSSTARLRATPRLTCWWVVMASAIWSPTVYTGVRADSGSWKTIEMPRPRTFVHCLSLLPSSSVPLNCTEPVMRAERGSSPMTAIELTDLPDPDSPTMPSASPGLRT